MKVFLVYAPRRVECTRCGVRVEEMPWADGKHPVTRTYAWFLASWAIAKKAGQAIHVHENDPALIEESQGRR